tara:strand:- start:883 stop:2145 length:1263 start_codon:yes stop_codon:yes gene_type:complete
MTTEISICNQALGKLGLKYIADTGPRGRIDETSDVTESAYLARDVYYSVRDAVLSEVAWRFAEERLILEPSATAPVWGSTSTAYDIPSGDAVGPDRVGYGFNGTNASGYWVDNISVYDYDKAYTVGVSFRLGKLPDVTGTYYPLIYLTGAMYVAVNANGRIITFTNAVWAETDLSISAGTRYDLTLKIDGTGAEYSLSVVPQFSTAPPTQFTGTYFTATWVLNIARSAGFGDAALPPVGFFWDAYIQEDSVVGLSGFWAIDAGSGNTAVGTVGGDLTLLNETNPNPNWLPMFVPSTLRVFRVYTDSAGTDPLGQAEWRQEQNTVVADHAGANLYALATKQMTDTNSWPALFSQAVVARLAAELSMALTRDTALYQLMWAEYSSKLSLAKAMDGGAGRSEQQTSSKLLSSRMGGGGPFRLY